MKKFLMAALVLAVATTVATAGVGIGWSVQWGGYDNTVTPPLTGGTGAILDSANAIWQLIYAGADNIANDISTTPPTTGGPNGDYVIGDDVVWAERTIAMGGGVAPEDSTSWDQWLSWGGGSVVYEDLGWATAGFSYQRVFEGTPANSSWYYETSLLALDTGYAGGGAAPQSFYLDTPTAGFQPGTQINVVPEPATMGLLGLGALVMAIRRRRK